MKNHIWIGDTQLDLGEPTSLLEDGKIVIEATLDDGRNVSVCLDPETWETIVAEVDTIGAYNALQDLGDEFDY